MGSSAKAATALTVNDEHLAMELLSRVMRAGAERIGRDSDPSAFAPTVRSAREIIPASLTAG
ncbi:hypothetical protein ACFVTT_12935 [Streptomyces niveus]|uniref:hypothetical protein n=1 Tax=Streptomyces niveus TaxID=193462 RepID=UPI0034437F4C